jgi:ABC-type glycerol-3-phosphate transport system substrate-binding protein
LIFWDTPSDADPRFHLPAQRSLVVMVYNQTWAKELGFDTPPATPEDFSQQACAAMRANIEDGDPQNDGTGGWLVDDSPLVVLSWMAGFGAPGFSGGIGEYPFDTPQTRQAFWFVKSLVDKGCAWIGRQPAPYEYFAQRYALFYTGSMEDLSEQTEVMNRLGAKDKWTVLPFPSTGETPTVVSFGPSYFILASDQAHQMASWLFLRWLTTPAQEVRFIRSTGTYPVRASVIPMMADYQRANPAWGTALPLINYARAAPTDLVWDRIRPMLQDAMHQLIQPETKIEQIPDILQMMQEMIRELFNP